MEKQKVKQVSCFLDSHNKRGIELNANIQKYRDEGDERANINRNMVFIFNAFIDKYKDDLDKLPDVVARTMHIDDLSSSTSKEQKKGVVGAVSYKVNNFPLKLTDEFNAKFAAFWKDCVKSLGFKLTKSHLYNVILMDFLQQNKLNDLQDLLDFYSQPKFKISKTKELDFEKLINDVNTILSGKENNDE